MKLGIYGGAFDPIHLGHLLLAESCLRQAELDRLIFVPTGVSPHRSGKESYGASSENRFEMIQAATLGCEEFWVSRYEIDKVKPSFTIDTLRYFSQSFSLIEPELFLIVGADMFNDLPNWRTPGEICRLATPLVACRPGTQPPYFEGLQGIVPVERILEIEQFAVDMPQIELSSTAIRRSVLQGKSIRFQVPHNVETYIVSHGLYRHAGQSPHDDPG